ncbi:LOW QUALITY PROTEIN: uncharacterized protein PS065_014540 [Dugong dugon]
MRPENQSSVEFLLLGLPIRPEQQDMFFALFLGMYLTTVKGNLFIILLIRLDSRLHTPMYFFLSHVAFSDVSFSSVTIPKMLINMHTQDQSIPYVGCISQMYVFILFVCLDNLLLVVMAYDRFVAICHPLHYTTIMREELCILSVVGSWFFSCVHDLLHTLLLSGLSFCADNTISHFFCDLTALLKLTCSDTSLNELVIFRGGVLVILPLSAILGSYVSIGASILKVPSTKWICKALSTCGSHSFVVFLYYGTLAIIYFFPSSNNSQIKDIIASVMYTVVTAMLNPFIYSLRNRDMKLALGMLYKGPLFILKIQKSSMRPENQSSMFEFLLLGLPIQPEQQAVFFALFLVMAYDRYVAICHPLHYTTIMRETIIPHFSCDLAVLKSSCSDTSFSELVIFTEGGLFFIVPLRGILGSYTHMAVTILTVLSIKRLSKALSTCGSHLFVVSVYYGTLAGIYFFSLSGKSKDEDIIASVMYMVVTPMLNPFIYSLRNKDIKCAFDVFIQKSSMRWENQSRVSEFLLLGFPISSEKQAMFFTLLLGMYLTTVLGNLLIILLIRLDSRLHTPMYFFLSHLALTDVSFSSVTVPKMLMNMQTQHLSICYPECISQTCFYILFGCIDNLLLGVMAYDRYVAICHPLHYTTIMRKELCVMLVAGSWILSCGSALLHTLLLAQLSFCADNTIPHFFCSLPILLKLSCSNTSLNELVIFITGAVVVILPLSGILLSYGRIGASILKVSSSKGIYKALSTCGSHLSVVSLFYGTIVTLYFSPSSSNSNEKDMIASLMYTVVTPMLNPFIYSLRNRDMKSALGILFRSDIPFSK